MEKFNPTDQLLDEQIEKILRSAPKFKRHVEADSAFYAALNKLVEEEDDPEAEKLTRAIFGFSWLKRIKTSFAGAMIVLAIFVGTLVMAYQPGVTRGDFLYPVKQVMEKVELVTALSPMSEMTTHLKFADRRLAEAQDIIDGGSGSLSGFVGTAKAASRTDPQLSPEKEQDLTLTLSDMSNEIGLAESIVGEKISEPETAQAALKEIQARAENHLAELERFEQKVPQNTRVVVIKFKNRTNCHIARTVEANEEVNQAFAMQAPRVNLVMLRLNVINAANSGTTTTDSATVAQRQLQDAMQILNSLQRVPVQHRDALENKIEMAKQALEEGKVGRAEGLSRAMQNQMKLMMEQQEDLMKIMQEQSLRDREAARELEKEEDEKKDNDDRLPQDIKREIRSNRGDEQKDIKPEGQENKSEESSDREELEEEEEKIR